MGHPKLRIKQRRILISLSKKREHPRKSWEELEKRKVINHCSNKLNHHLLMRTWMDWVNKRKRKQAKMRQKIWGSRCQKIRLIKNIYTWTLNNNIKVVRQVQWVSQSILLSMQVHHLFHWDLSLNLKALTQHQSKGSHYLVRRNTKVNKLLRAQDFLHFKVSISIYKVITYNFIQVHNRFCKKSKQWFPLFAQEVTISQILSYQEYYRVLTWDGGRRKSWGRRGKKYLLLIMFLM